MLDNYYDKIAAVTGVDRELVKRVVLATSYIPKEGPKLTVNIVGSLSNEDVVRRAIRGIERGLRHA